jgi:murein DD-endopeptidase MepM/ murein hydrolase activator NlpD
MIAANTPTGRSGGFGLCGDGPGGVSFTSLAAAFSSIEGNYNSVGVYTAGGYGLGRYQYMTSRRDVQDIIKQKPGGQAFLDKADRGGGISEAEVARFFTQADQDALFKADQTRNIEQALSEGFTGSRIIERVGQIHFGGPNATIDGEASDVHGRLTLKTYGEELAETYRSVESSSESSSQCSAPTPVEPLQARRTGTLSAQEYGAPRPRGRSHAGQDLDLGPNDSFQSYVGGEVVGVGYDDGGYYHYIDIYNADLGVVERIAELDNFAVGVGDTIAAGQVVGSGTTTTGVVHLEYRDPVNTQKQGGFGIQGTYDPIEYLENLGVLQRSGQMLNPVEHSEGDGHEH